tara:strand:+ start:4047 stop:5288 length:1242 start_codon:yes stop_codon:yes gene_type:complete
MKDFEELSSDFSRGDRRKSKSLDAAIDRILDKALVGMEVSEQDGVTLFNANQHDIKKVFSVADKLRERANGDEVTFVVNRNINFTNVCYMGCKFCGFAKKLNQKGSELLSIGDIVLRAQEAWDRGATEVCIQGGLHPKISGDIYRNIILGIKQVLPNMHIHAFSPFEIWFGASKKKLTYTNFLRDLKDCGLGSMPGTAAEILDVDIRKMLTKNKLSTEQWIEIIRTAHSLNIPTTATIMYGHIDSPVHWAMHLATLRRIQKETGGFTELVPLSFVHKESPLYKANPTIVRRGPTLDEIKRMHAIARIMLSGWIDNIQVSWTKLGPKIAQEMLSLGVNDLGGTLMNESISRSSGAEFGQEITASEMVKIIRHAGKVPMQRNTTYDITQNFDNCDPKELTPLIPRNGTNPLEFIN